MENQTKIRAINPSDRIHSDCPKFCRSVRHGNEITAAITKSNMCDSELCSSLNDRCNYCESVKDSYGRTALHLAASCGKVDLVRWLLNVRNADINMRDWESGFTPLIRALFYGKINVAVELIRLGANTSIIDTKGFTAFGHCLNDGPMPCHSFGDLYAWGLNKNNSMGLFGVKEIPESLEIFHKKFPNVLVRQVCLSKFHSIIVSTEGSVYSCGHGFGGRLGLGSETAVVEPTKINFLKRASIKTAAVGRDHSLFVSSDDVIYSVGFNKYRVLGIVPVPEKFTSPTVLEKSILNIQGICAGNYHSLVWTARSLFVWGVNVGQFGPCAEGNFYINTPRQIQNKDIERTGIRHVASSDGAIGVLTKNGDILIFHECLCRKIASRFEQAVNINMVGGNCNISLDEDMKNDQMYELKVLIRTNSGELFLWRKTDPIVCKCLFSIPRNTFVKDAFINSNEILLVTEIGEAYMGSIMSRRRKPSYESKNNVDREQLVNIDLRKISRIQRAVAIVSDTKGEDYCIIQQEPYEHRVYTSLLESEMKKDIEKLLNESSEDDCIHDVKIKVGDRIFPCHKYILGQGSVYLKQLCDECSDREIVLTDLTEDTFQEMRLFIYTGTCDVLTIDDHSDEFQKYFFGDLQDKATLESEKLSRNPLCKLLEAAKKYRCTKLVEVLTDSNLFDTHLINKKFPVDGEFTPDFLVETLPEYHDVILKCNDNVEVKAHKCILATRVEYFRIKFSTRWTSETSTVDFLHPSNVAEEMLKYVYTDATYFLRQKDCDFLSKLLIASDEYLMLTLKQHCERILIDLRLDIKTAVNLLRISYHYRAPLLMDAVIKFMIQNIAYFLEIQALNELGDDILLKLTEEYCKQRHVVYNRNLLPDWAASDDSTVEIKDPNSESKIVRSAPKKVKRRRGAARRRFPVDENEAACGSSTSPTRLHFPVSPAEIGSSLLTDGTSSDALRRLSSISVAAMTVQVENHAPRFINLNERSSADDFPLLNGATPRSRRYSESASSYGRLANRSRMVRLSQRERRRLSESSETNTSNSETPKNPWKTLPPLPTTQDVSPPSETSFDDIVQSEKKLKENLTRMTNKSLICTQVEDRAILELERFYNVSNIEDEIIVIQRVDIGRVACPTWVPKKHR